MTKKTNRSRSAFVGLGLTAMLCAALSPTCKWPDPKLAENQAPVIEGILVNGEETDNPSAREGEKVVLQAVIWDPNGDEFPGENIQWSFSDGAIEGNGTGASVVWTAPFVVWENPPQDIFVTVTVTVDDGRGAQDQAELTIRVLPPCRQDNQRPVITEMTADPVSIALGDTTTVTAVAEDPDGDPITYEWTVPFGYHEGGGPQIVWVTTDVCCRDWYPVQLVVSDGCDASWGKVDVEVIP